MASKNKSVKKKKLRLGGIKHHHITRILYIALVGFLLATGLVIFAYSETLPAKADVLPFVHYAGLDVGPIPNLSTIPGAQLACPGYILMDNKNITPENPYATFGLFVLPGQELKTYSFQTLDVPSSCHIGGYVPVPNLACGFTHEGGPVFPIFFDGLNYFDAGSGPNCGD